MYPKVLITGHPNSGTSFLCNLVAEMGFSRKSGHITSAERMEAPTIMEAI